IDSGVVQFRQAKTLRWRNTIQTRRIDGARRTMTAPRSAGDFVKLVPVAFLPSGHCVELFAPHRPKPDRRARLRTLDAHAAQKVPWRHYSQLPATGWRTR